MSQLTVQLPDAVMQQIGNLAAREQLSIEEYVARILSRIGEDDRIWQGLVRRGRSVSDERLRSLLSKAGGEPPAETDRVD